jgi:hypothetical protein
MTLDAARARGVVRIRDGGKNSVDTAFIDTAFIDAAVAELLAGPSRI